MKQLINTSISSKWLMPEADLIPFMQNYQAMVDSNKVSNLTKEEIEKHIAEHIPVKLVEASTLTDVQKQAFGLNFVSSGGRISSGKVAVIEVFGTLFARWDFYVYWYGGVGMDMLGAILDTLEKDSTIDGVVLHIDSNGGELAGTEFLANKIWKYTKPINAYVENAAHSAAYWLASQCNEIYAASQTTYMGSIGVMMRHVNRAEMYKMNGLEITYITAPQSVNKVILPDNSSISEKDLQIVQDMLRQDCSVFINAVKRGRKDVVDIEAVSAADIFPAAKAKALGLHDGIAANGITDVIARVYKLAEEKRNAKSAENDFNSNTEKAENQMEKLKINVETSQLSVMAVAKDKKLVIVAVADLQALDAKLEGVETPTEVVKSDDVKLVYENLGISCKKASIINVLSYDKNKFVLVDADKLHTLDAFCKTLGESEETTDVVEDSPEVAETVVETPEATVVEQPKAEEKTEKKVAETPASESNISPEIAAIMAKMDEMSKQMEAQKNELNAQLVKAEEARAKAEETTAKVIANAEEVQRKMGFGKVVTVVPQGKEEEKTAYNLGEKSQRADAATLKAKEILAAKNPNADKGIYDPEKTTVL